MKKNVNGLTIAYSREGAGKTVLLLHGWDTSKQNFTALQVALSRKFDVIALDFPGFGQSDMPKSDWTVRSYAELVKHFLEEIGVEHVYAVIGHSFGGRVIIKGVSEELLSAQKIVLIGSAGVKHSDSLRNVAFKMVAKTGKRILSFPGLNRFSGQLRRRLYDAAGSSDYLQANEIMKRVFVATVNEDLSKNAEKITNPTLLVWGSEDKEAPLGDGRYFASVMPDATLKIVQEAGHFVHNDNPRKVQAWIESFLG